MTGRVLVATGGLITGKERSFPLAARKWWQQWRAADEAWLDLKVKLVMAEPLLAGRFEARRLPRDLRETLRGQGDREPPSLTEVVLTTLLHHAGLAYERMELDEVFSAPGEVDRKLAATDCVFLSSTYLHDLSEVEPLLRRLKRPHNRIVLGGALAGILHDRWEGAPELAVITVLDRTEQVQIKKRLEAVQREQADLVGELGSANKRFGTMNNEIPFTPAGPPGILASTRCTILSESSCSPPEIHILLPKMR